MTIVRLLVAGTLIVAYAAAAQAATDEEKCLAGRAKAKGKYEQCVAKWLSREYGGGMSDYDAAMGKLSKCRIKYAAAWTKLQGLGTTCAVVSRYTDNANGTITDNLTGLVWEKKSDNGDVHDKDSFAMWSTGSPYNGDGTAFTTFLRDGLNSGAGFAGTNDWRLPTFAELQTILLPEPYPCATDPCVDAAFNSSCAPGCSATTCSCTKSLYYFYSATTDASDSSLAWGVDFGEGGATAIGKVQNDYARAVRGGL